MDILADFSLDVTVWLQENLPQLEGFLTIFSNTGRFEFYLVFMTLIYWSLEKRLGRALIYVMVLSYSMNSMLKHFFADPRPYWRHPEISISTDKQFGIPSGHTQGATVLYGLIALWARKTWLWVVAFIMVIIMGLSRIYLGVHDIEDVVAGIILGSLVLIGYALWQKYVDPLFSNRILGQRLLVALLVPLLFAIVYITVLTIIGQPEEEPSLASFIETAEIKSYDDFATGFGLLVGLGIGFILEVSRVRFKVEGQVWKRVIRYILGLATTLLIWMGLGYYIPDEPIGVMMSAQTLLGIVGGLWVSYYVPWVFVRLGLADASPKPEVSITF